jgi:hypothetical protein
MAAGLAMLQAVLETDACAYSNRLGAHARELLNSVCESERLPFVWYGEFSAFHVLQAQACDARPRTGDMYELPLEAFMARDPLLTNRLRMALNVLGMDVNTRCSGLLGRAHSGRDVQSAAEMFASAGAMLRREGYLSG